MKRITRNGYEVQIDPFDLPLWFNNTWYVGRAGCKNSYKLYLATRVRETIVRWHRVVMNPPEGLEVDHINGNSLDNRRSNLRLCNKSQNNMNRTVFKKKKTGVFRGTNFCRTKNRKRRWLAILMVNKKRLRLGSYYTEHEAALAYDKAAQHYYGEFAHLNFPKPQP